MCKAALEAAGRGQPASPGHFGEAAAFSGTVIRIPQCRQRTTRPRAISGTDSSFRHRRFGQTIWSLGIEEEAEEVIGDPSEDPRRG